VLLTLAFPKLRILWSSSPYESAEIFERLKSQEEEPDPIAAVRAGLENEEEVDSTLKPGGAEQQMFNQVPQDMLAQVPGVTTKNIMNIVYAAENIKEVANMTVEELQPLVGREAASKICGFFAKDLLEDEG
jgi:DNA excision repair protein ERCC-4